MTSRREFLSALAGGVAINAWPGWAAAAGTRRLLVLVELKGGNDGLNTVIPYDDPLYAKLRPRIAVPRDQVVSLGERTALHPSLAALKPLWEARELAIVQ